MPCKSKALCHGCYDDFYNHPGQHGSTECWSFKAAEVVTRWRLGWWDSPVKENAHKVTTLSCYHEPGRAAFLKAPPTLTRADLSKHDDSQPAGKGAPQDGVSPLGSAPYSAQPAAPASKVEPPSPGDAKGAKA